MDDFQKYMSAVDIACNLRYPYNGENSGSCTRLLQMGKCVIVNDIGSFSEIPDEAVIKLTNVEHLTEEQEINNLYECLKNLLDNRSIIEEKSRAAKCYADEKLSLENIERQYVDAINDLPHFTITEDALKAFARTEWKKLSEIEKRKTSKTIANAKM